MSQLYVGSEIGQLKRVLLHRPGRALSHLTPSNYKALLFDDVLAVERTGKEHDIFTETLRAQDVEVLLLHDLLAQTLAINDAKQWLLKVQVSEYRLGHQLAHDVQRYLSELDLHQLADILLGGLSYDEFPLQSVSMMQALHSPDDFIIAPLPNHLFTRDTSCWIYGGVSLNPMAMDARQRETHHLRAIYRWHPLFANQNFVNYFDQAQTHYDNVMIEGGDVLVIGNGTVLIGISQRTSPQGVELLARRLFQHHQAKQVIAVSIPKDRACMHLDTVMTHIDIDTFSLYPEVMRRSLPCWRLTPQKGNNLKVQAVDYFLHAIESALSISHLNIITTGGNRFEAEREQWHDANNVLTLRPGVVIAYEANQYTNEKYDKAGIIVLPIPGDQLGRGRGGARCMSCPIERESINLSSG